MNIDINTHAVFSPLYDQCRYKGAFGGRGCVHPDTLIDTPTGQIRVSEFAGGDVYSWKDGRRVTAIATPAQAFTLEPMLKVTLIDGRSMIVTHQHRFLTSRGWQQASLLGPSDVLVALDAACCPSFSYSHISLIETSPPVVYWDLHVYGTNNYLSNGIVNHNSGKSHDRAEALVELALSWPGMTGGEGLRWLCFREIQKSLKESSKRLIENKIKQFGLEGEFRVLKTGGIITPGDGLIEFVGLQDHTADSIKSYEGFHGAWGEEAQTISKTSMNLLRPTIRWEDSSRGLQSELWFTWNPRFKSDAVDTLFRGGGLSENQMRVVHANWSDNPLFPAVLEEERLAYKENYPHHYEWVWEGGYMTVSEGAYYSKQLTKARSDGRVVDFLAHDPLLPWKIFVDIGGTGGKSDAFSMWVAQLKPNRLDAHNYYEAQGQGGEYHVSWLRENDYTPANTVIYLPHDGDKHSQIRPESYASFFAAAGYKVEVVPNQGAGAAMKRVEVARRVFPAIFFDEKKCSGGLDAIGWYHEKIDEKRRIGLGPDHDWSSHCFVGETEVLTRSGTCPIMDLPESGEVLTLCGWKQYKNPRVTRANARLVEVKFTDGLTVRCTPDHLFLTGSGWRSAESLTPSSEILSTLTRSPSILMAAYTVCGPLKDTFQRAVVGFTETSGLQLLARFQRAVTSTIKTAISLITSFGTLSALTPANTCPSICGKRVGAKGLLTEQERRRLSGIGQMKAGYGIAGTQKGQKIGQNGSGNLSRANIAARFLMPLLGKAGTLKSIALAHVRQQRIESGVSRRSMRATIESVRQIDKKSDVWCMTVPGVGHFSLSNGAVVHNCADAFGLMCVVYLREREGKAHNIESNEEARYINRMVTGKHGWMKG